MTFHELYEKYAADVYRLALALSGSRVEAEDVTSETFMRAFAGIDTLRMPTVKAYLLTVARNLVFMRFRQQRKHTVLGEEMLDVRPDPAQEWENNSERRAFRQLLQALPAAERTALLLRVVNELSYEEIATMEGISVALAKVRVHRARKKLIEYHHQEKSHERHDHPTNHPGPASGLPFRRGQRGYQEAGG